MPNRKRQFFLALLAGVGLWFIGLVMSGQPAQSAAALPPRPTPEPTPMPEQPSETGGYIQLWIEAAPAEIWTVVQWQDALGGWHNVEGWQGTLDDGRTKLWWVAPEDFATGPFRWATYASQEGELLGYSPAFTLPAVVREVAQVELMFDSSGE